MSNLALTFNCNCNWVVWQAVPVVGPSIASSGAASSGTALPAAAGSELEDLRRAKRELTDELGATKNQIKAQQV